MGVYDEEDTTSTAEESAAAASYNNNSTAAAMSPASSTTAAAGGDAAIPGLPPPALRRLVEYAASYAAASGLQVEVKGAPPGRYVSAPVSLLPQSYPSYAFERAVSLSVPFGALVDGVSRDAGFLRGALAEARGVDEYTDALLVMYEEIYLGEFTQSDCGGVFFFGFLSAFSEISERREKDGGDGGRSNGAGAGFGSFAPRGKIRHRISIADCPPSHTHTSLLVPRPPPKKTKRRKQGYGMG